MTRGARPIPRLEDLFEERASNLPNGLLGPLAPPQVNLVDGRSPKAVQLPHADLSGPLSTTEFASPIEAIRPQGLRYLQRLG